MLYLHGCIEHSPGCRTGQVVAEHQLQQVHLIHWPLVHTPCEQAGLLQLQRGDVSNVSIHFLQRVRPISVCAAVDVPMSCVLIDISRDIGVGIGKGAAYLEEAGVLLGEHQGVHSDSELLRTTHAKRTQ